MRQNQARMPRRRRTGYATGGSVASDAASSYGTAVNTGVDPGEMAPVLMSTALDSRRDNPDHSSEDFESISTRPGGAPSAPDEIGYKKGGPVRRTGYASGGNVDEDEEDSIEEEPQDDEEAIEPVSGVEEDDQEDGEDLDPEGRKESRAEREIEDEEKAEDEEGAGKKPAKTGYNAPPTDQDDRDPAALQAQQNASQEPTGYNRASQDVKPAGSALQDVLDWTRRIFGLDGNNAAPTLGDAQSRPWYAQDNGMLPVNAVAAAGRAADSGIRSVTSNLTGPTTSSLNQPPISPELSPDESTPRDPFKSFNEAQRPTDDRFAPPLVQRPPTPDVPGAKPAGQGGIGSDAARTSEPPTAAPATNVDRNMSAPLGKVADPQVAIRDYVNGARAFTPDQMSELLDRTSRDNPGIDMNGAIAKTLRDLHARGDMDGASRFLQGLRPSYNNVQASAIAAASMGRIQDAAKLASTMDNLIPGGANTNFTVGQDGNVHAVVRPENGNPSAFTMTPQQFAQYISNPAMTGFDHAAEVGTENSLLKAGAKPASMGVEQGGTAGAGAATGGAQTGVGTIGPSSAQQRQMGYEAAQRAAAGTPEQQAQRQKDKQNVDRDYQLRLKAYEAYPMSNQRAQRQNLLERLRGQDSKVEAARLQSRSRENVANINAQSRSDTQQAYNDRAAKRLDWLSQKDVQDNLSRLTSSAQRNAMGELIARRKAEGDNFKASPQDQQLISRMGQIATQPDIYNALSRQLPRQEAPPTAPGQPTAPAQAAPTSNKPAVDSVKTIGNANYRFDGTGWLLQAP